VKEITMVTAAFAELESCALARLLFASPVQPSEYPSPAAVRMAVAAQFRSCRGNLAACLAHVAQEAGDHPDDYATRMRWAIRAVDGAYGSQLRRAA
jgi:hypothetical protein